MTMSNITQDIHNISFGMPVEHIDIAIDIDNGLHVSACTRTMRI